MPVPRNTAVHDTKGKKFHAEKPRSRLQHVHEIIGIISPPCVHPITAVASDLTRAETFRPPRRARASFRISNKGPRTECNIALALPPKLSSRHGGV